MTESLSTTECMPAMAPGQHVVMAVQGAVHLVQIETVENINFAVLESVLLRDAMSVAALNAAGLHPGDARAMLSLRAHDRSAQPSVRLDLRTEACFWLNDLEKDPVYRSVAARVLHMAVCRGGHK